MTEPLPSGDVPGQRTAGGAAGFERPIAFFLHTLDDRGVARVATAVIAELARQGVPVLVICVTRNRSSEVVGLPADVPVIDLAIPFRGTMFAIPRLARELRRHRPAVLIANGPGPNRASVVARALARTDTALVLVEHTHGSSNMALAARSRLGRHARELFTGLVYPRAERVAGVTPGVIEDLGRRHPRLRSRLAVLPNPAPEPLTAERRSLPRAVPCATAFEDGPTICCVANLIPRKGQLVLIEALAIVRDRVPHASLILVGRPDDAEYVLELEAATRRLGLEGAVCFAGYQADPLPFIASSDVFALASYTEGFGLVIVEAMACETPVIATDCPSGPDFILDGGRYGILTPMGDPVALADGLTAVLTDEALAARLAEAGRRRAAEFQPRHIADEYLRLARAAIDDRAGRRVAA